MAIHVREAGRVGAVIYTIGYFIIERVVKTVVSYLRSANPDGAQFPCFSQVILTQVLQEVVFFGIIQSERCMHKTHLRELWRCLRYMGMHVPAQT